MTIEKRQITLSIVASSVLALLLAAAPAFSAEPESEKSAQKEQVYIPIAVQVLKAQKLAREYFFNSVQEALPRVQASAAPIQVDLYILVHYLMYQDMLQFSAAPHTNEWKEKISNYFISTLGKKIWEPEGCLAVKVMIGLFRSSTDLKTRRKLEQYYRDLVFEKWGETGVGECFSSRIERTYGQGTPECSGVSEELNLKVAYYQHLVREERDNPMHDIVTPTMNSYKPEEVNGWWSAVPEMWVQALANLPGQEKISARRRQLSARAVRRAVNTFLLEKAAHNGTFTALLLYSYLLTDAPSKSKADPILRKLLSLQQPDGSFPGIGMGLRSVARTHNLRATPTYFALLALERYSQLFPQSKS